MKRPQRSQHDHRLTVFGKHPQQAFALHPQIYTARCTLLELLTRSSGEPFVVVAQEREKLGVAELGDIGYCGFRRLAVRDFVNSTRLPVHPIVVVALAGIRPVTDVDASIGCREQINPAEPRIRLLREIGRVLSDIARSSAHHVLHV